MLYVCCPFTVVPKKELAEIRELVFETYVFLGTAETDTYHNKFIARFKNWGDGPFNWPCRGKRVRSVCILGIGDLRLLVSRPELFANKFHLDFEPTALNCLEQLHYNRTHDEAVGIETFNVSFYTQLSFVGHHQ